LLFINLYRPDHNLQDIRNKVFPLRRKKCGTPEPPSLPLPARRKERSLSSLAVSAPRVSSQSGLTGRRTKLSRRSIKSPANDENTSNKRAKVLDDEKAGSAAPRLAKLNRKHVSTVLCKWSCLYLVPNLIPTSTRIAI
jgi:E3 ubiquitin-protein ligase DRIP